MDTFGPVKEPYDVRKHAPFAVTLENTVQGKDVLDAYFDVLMKTLPIVWQMVKPLSLSVEIGPLWHSPSRELYLHTTEWPDEVHREVHSSSIARPMGNAAELVAALTEMQKSEPARFELGERDMMGLRFRASLAQLEDPTADANHVVARFFDRYSENVPLVHRDGKRFVPWKPAIDPDAFEPLDLWFSPCQMFLTSYWNPWSDRRSRTHQLVRSVLSQLAPIGWRITEDKQAQF